MTIQKKVWLSNILMVLIPIFVTIFITILNLQASFGSYLHSLEMMYRDENGIQSAQSLIYTYQQELWENNWEKNGRKRAAETIQQSKTMYHLERKLEKMGYCIAVKKNGKILYSNISDADMQAAGDIAGETLCSARTMTVCSENVFVIKNTFIHEEKEFSIIAVNNKRMQTEVESYFQNYIMKYIVISLSLFFGLTILVNWMLSYWVSKSVLIPLRSLSLATREIKEGNLDMKIRYETKDEFMPVFHDFDEMRKYLKESVEQRLENEKRRKDMISGISHDIRTPLTSISGYVDGLIEGIADTEEKQKRYLKAIKIRTGDLERLVNSLSDYNRLGHESLKYHLIYADLKTFLKKYLAAYEDEAKNNRVTVRFDAEEKYYPIYLDEEKMNRVMDNLFTNTVRYREKPDSVVWIRLTTENSGKWVCLMFHDDGPGVPAESLERIFDTFYRTDSARTHSGKGSGIGLAVVKEIIEGHGGYAYAENQQGLSIIIRLPIIKEKKDD
ncbi:MAG: sensor histidine kinase [Oliverpabstia sp.]